MKKGLKINPYVIRDSHRSWKSPEHTINIDEYKPLLIWGVAGSKDAFKLDERAWESVFYRTKRTK